MMLDNVANAGVVKKLECTVRESGRLVRVNRDMQRVCVRGRKQTFTDV
jgi:hypothetical protein